MIRPAPRPAPQPAPQPQPQPPAPQPQPQPQPPAPQPEKEKTVDKCASDKKETNVLEYLVKHPIAPLAGAVLLLGSMFSDEPQPPTIPPNLPPDVAATWQMIYAQNLARFQKRMQLWETVGKVLLGYADTQAVLAALPKKAA